MKSRIARGIGAIRIRPVDLVFVSMMVVSFLMALEGPSIAEDKRDLLFLDIAGVCVAGLIFRWGWLVPSTIFTWFICDCAPKLASSADERLANQVAPVLMARVVAAVQIVFGLIIRLFQSPAPPVVQAKAQAESRL